MNLCLKSVPEVPGIGKAAPGVAGISYLPQFYPGPLQFWSSSLSMAWESGRRWPKTLGPCYPWGRPRRSIGSWLWNSSHCSHLRHELEDEYLSYLCLSSRWIFILLKMSLCPTPILGCPQSPIFNNVDYIAISETECSQHIFFLTFLKVYSFIWRFWCFEKPALLPLQEWKMPESLVYYNHPNCSIRCQTQVIWWRWKWLPFKVEASSPVTRDGVHCLGAAVKLLERWRAQKMGGQGGEGGLSWQ